MELPGGTGRPHPAPDPSIGQNGRLLDEGHTRGAEAPSGGGGRELSRDHVPLRTRACGLVNRGGCLHCKVRDGHGEDQEADHMHSGNTCHVQGGADVCRISDPGSSAHCHLGGLPKRSPSPMVGRRRVDLWVS
jgi:hypothetical protein